MNAPQPSARTKVLSLHWLHGRLARTTASGEFIAEVDGLRFLAISAVILHHLTASYLETTRRLGAVRLPAQWWEVFPQSKVIAWGYAGHFGVHLFFVISGFILALPFARAYAENSPRPHLGSYFLRRLVRLEPPYVINLALAFLGIVLINPGWGSFIPHFFASLPYLHGLIFGQSSWINGVAWSLEVEAQFYLTMPLLALIFAVRPRMLRRALIGLEILALAYLAGKWMNKPEHPRLQLSLFNQLHFFLAGFLLADLYLARSSRGFRFGLRWDALAALAGAGIFEILTRRYHLYFLTPWLIMALYAGLFLGRIGHALLRQPWAVAIGGMCYTIYLYHFMIINLLAPWTMRWASPERPILWDFLIQCALLVPPILLASAILFIGIEKPFMNLSRAVGRRFRRGDEGRAAISTCCSKS